MFGGKSDYVWVKCKHCKQVVKMPRCGLRSFTRERMVAQCYQCHRWDHYYARNTVPEPESPRQIEDDPMFDLQFDQPGF